MAGRLITTVFSIALAASTLITPTAAEDANTAKFNLFSDEACQGSVTSVVVGTLDSIHSTAGFQSFTLSDVGQNLFNRGLRAIVETPANDFQDFALTNAGGCILTPGHGVAVGDAAFRQKIGSVSE